MLEWKSPEICDKKKIQNILDESDTLSSDLSFANLFLLKNKYDTKIATEGGFLYRKYFGNGDRYGYTFPIGKGNIKDAFEKLFETAEENGEKLKLIFLTEEQKDWIEENYPYKFVVGYDRGNDDYIYSREKLSLLKGKKLSNKRNHISRFSRANFNTHIEDITDKNKADALKVAKIWKDDKAEDISVDFEFESIKLAIDNFKELDLIGKILYDGNKPIGMTIASYITPKAIDVHFEKVLDIYASEGGYTVINNLFVKSLDDRCVWVNREEDINISGLRKAKMSYYPEILLKKYSAMEGQTDA